MITCEIFRRHVDAVIDGEVDPNTQIELEEHLEQCPECREHQAFARSFKRQVADALVHEHKAPASLRDRLRVALDREDEQRRAPASEPPAAPAGPPLGMPGLRLPFVKPRYAMPAAAAAVALAVIAAREGGNPLTPQDEQQTADVMATQDASVIWEDVVRRHAVEHPTEVRGAAPQVANWLEGQIGLAVRPIEFDQPGVHLIGGRISSVQDRDAATFYYEVQGRRVTVVVFEPSEPVDRFAQKINVDGRGIYYGRVHGYTVPVVEHDGLTYAIAGDLDSDSLLELAASAHVDDN